MRLLTISLLLISALPVAAQAAQDSAAQRSGLDRALQDWRTVHGANWRARLGGEEVEFLYGGAARAPLAVRSDADRVLAAEHFAAGAALLHGVAPETLRPERVIFLPLGQAGSTDKWAVEFSQSFAGVPVAAVAFQVLLAGNGSLLAIQSRAVTQTATLDVAPTLTTAAAVARAREEFLVDAGVPAQFTTEPELVVVRTEVARGALAWQIDVRAGDGSTPAGWRYHIDAHTGERLQGANLVHSFDVGGTVMTMASPGLFPDESTNPPAPLPLSHARVTSSAGTVVTDADGNFNFPGVNTPLSVTISYEGPFNNSVNSQGGDYSLTTTAQVGTNNGILLNPSPNEFTTAQANAHLSVNHMRDWVRAVIPTDSTADFQATSNVNINNVCNAVYTGNAINFFNAGNGCRNTSYTTVVAHEYGHWLNALYGTGNGFDGMGEGNADVFAMYAYDTAQTGHDLCGFGCNGRTGLNTRQYCGDNCGACYGEVHLDGEVWMGAAWKVRANLNATHGDAPGDLIADTLFLSWMNAFNQSQISSVIETQWLTLDDDDGNLDNGTPNYAEIDAGFRTQGFPGFDPPFAQINVNAPLADTGSETGPYDLFVQIIPTFAPPITAAALTYRVDGGPFMGVPMAHQGSDVYLGSIPGQASPAVVEYYVIASDSNGDVTTWPTGALSGNTSQFFIGDLTIFLDDDFESPSGWTGGDVGDTASTGVWVQGDPLGTGAQPALDHTEAGNQCFFSGQGSSGGALGENDVDGGTTSAVSPPFSLDGLDNPIIDYWRWYSNDEGDSPGDDIFVAQLSNNGGLNYVTVSTIGPDTFESRNECWFPHRIMVSQFLAPTANMRLRFQASDLSGGSIVEAAIDDIVGWNLGESGCGAPSNYGLGKLNSANAFPNIGFSGSTSMAAGTFEINLETLIPLEPAQLFSGPASVTAPFFNGFRLVAFPITRENLGPMDASGFRSVPVPITPAMVGSVRYYQFFYRDPSHPDGTSVGLTDGLMVEFCP